MLAKLWKTSFKKQASLDLKSRHGVVSNRAIYWAYYEIRCPLDSNHCTLHHPVLALIRIE